MSISTLYSELNVLLPTWKHEARCELVQPVDLASEESLHSDSEVFCKVYYSSIHPAWTQTSYETVSNLSWYIILQSTSMQTLQASARKTLSQKQVAKRHDWITPDRSSIFC